MTTIRTALLNPRRAPLLFAALALTALASCSDEGPGVAPDDKNDVGDSGVQTDTGGGADTADDAGSQVEDTATDTGSSSGGDDGGTSSGGDDTGEGPKDTGPTSCSSDQYCLTLLANELKKCETAVCELASGQCKKQKKLGTCCDDTDCADKNECTTEQCDLATNTCKYAVKPNCCPGAGKNVNFADEGFEQGGNLPTDWATKNSLKDSNVQWHISTNRARSGKRSLYLGNECKTYDTSMNEKNGCKGGDSKTFKAEISTKEALVPANTDAIAHFWIWIDAQPLYTKTDDKQKQAFQASNKCQPKQCAEKGKCAGPCCFAETCVKLPNGPDQCLGERDVLKLYVQVKGEKHAVWDSSCINKSTGGQWVHQLVHLAPYLKGGGTAGEAVKMIWEFDTGTGTLNDYEGVYIDDFKMETLCTGDAGFAQCSSQTPCDPKKAGLCGDPKCTTALNGELGLCFYDKAPTCCATGLDCADMNSCTIDSCKQESKDKAGTCQNVPDSANPQCCQPSNAFKENFESGSTGAWDFVECNSKTVIWHATKAHAKSGDYGLCFGTTDGKSYDDPSIKPKGPKCTVCSKKIKISAGTVYNTLSFAVKMKTEWTGQPKYVNPHPLNPDLLLDRLRVFVKDAGKDVDLWTSDAIKGSSSKTGDDWFVALSSKLDQFAGKEKAICIEFDAGDANGNGNGHVCIDDVSVDVGCSKKECTDDAHCTDAPSPCHEAKCTDKFLCEYTKKKDCCQSEKDCNDNNTCTQDKCDTDGKCVYVVDPKNKDCCSPATTKDNGALLDEGFESGKKEGPDGWSLKLKEGQPTYGGGVSYDKKTGWSVTTLKSKPGTGNFSLYFGNNGTYNAGDTAAVGAYVDLPTLDLQGSTKAHHVVSFDLFLDTEWTKATLNLDAMKIPGTSPQEYLDWDRFRVYAKDSADAKAKWLPVFDSYEIGGSTRGKWTSIAAVIPKELAGKKVTVRLDFDSGNAKNNQYEGAYVDNLKVQTWCAAPACGKTADCVKADKCQQYHCGLDAKTAAPACAQEFKPGPGCCAPTLALPLETGEGGGFDNWEIASPTIGDVNWHVVKKGTPGIPTYLNGNAEIRFGSKSKPHYLAGSGDKCATDKDCKTSGESCTKDATGGKGCYLAVKGVLRSKVVTPDTDPKTGLVFKFKAYIDIEKDFAFETLELVAMDETAQNQLGKALWKKDDLKAGDYKQVIDVKVDLKDLEAAGSKFRLELRFNSGDANQNDKYLGIHVDDLAIERTCLP